MWKEAQWLGVPREEIEEKKIYQGDMNGRFAFYRLTFSGQEGAALTADVSANSRYRLWLNGEPVLSGPCRSDEFRQYYETVDLGGILRTGKNVLAVQVLLCDSMYSDGGPADRRDPLRSVATIPAGHRLALEGSVIGRDGKILANVTTGRADWKVWLDNTWYLEKENPVNGNMGAITEHIDFTRTPSGWKRLDFDDADWRAAAPIESAAAGFEAYFGILKKFSLEERPIPLLYERRATLEKELGAAVMGGADHLVVAPHEKAELLFDGEELFNAYFRYHFQGGRGAKIAFTCFEKFTAAGKKIRRDDYTRGEIGPNGQRDTIILDGSDMIYEPFWYRTMRFLRVEICAADEEVIFWRPELRRTGYPLNPASFVRSSAAWVQELYDVCVRTLQGCMMETYMDCPFWEQMQYPMDTRLQALFTYACSTDTKLAKKALSDFHDSLLPVGLVQGRAPGNPKQVISTFSLYYIFMLREYYQRTGDTAILKRYRSDVDAMLEYYDRKIGADGLVEDPGFWPFVDWQPAWNDNFGRPAALRKGPSTIINLMYGAALLDGAKICEATGRPGLAGEYRARQRAIADRVQALCWDEGRQMYREGPDYEEYTQHAQSWAVLNGMVSGQAAAELMKRTFHEDDVLRCYFSTCYELFRACEAAGCYGETKEQMDWWIALLDEHCTTCPETPGESRSECHAWSALPLYELVSVIGGVRREGGDPSSVTICPHLAYVPDLEGSYATEYGPVTFSYRKEEGRTFCAIGLPEGMTGTFLTPSGKRRDLLAGENSFFF